MHNGSFEYRSVIGKLNNLEKGYHPDIAYIVHQYVRFTSTLKKEHVQSLQWLGRYPKGTQKKGTIFNPKTGKYLDVYVDYEFAGNWDQDNSLDRDTTQSRHGYRVMYAGCPLVRKSQLHT